MSKIDKSKMIVEETNPQGVSLDPHDRAHERRDVDVRGIMISIGALLGITGLVMVIVYFLFNVMEGRAVKQDGEISPMADSIAYPPAPRLQPSPPTYSTEAQDLVAMRAFEDSMLTTSGWVDQPNGIARIPVDSAMAIIAARGTSVVTNAPAAMPKPDTAGATSGMAPKQTTPTDSSGAAGIQTSAPPGGALEKENAGMTKKK